VGNSRLGRVKIPSCLACDRPLIDKVRLDSAAGMGRGRGGRCFTIIDTIVHNCTPYTSYTLTYCIRLYNHTPIVHGVLSSSSMSQLPTANRGPLSQVGITIIDTFIQTNYTNDAYTYDTYLSQASFGYGAPAEAGKALGVSQ
jgi:hypothetical protein